MDIHTLSRLNRFKVIVLTLIKYGFGDLISRLDLPEKILPVKIKRYSAAERNTWVRIRLVLEELGPTFIKLGQILSLRADLIPAPMASELRKLQDEVPPEDFSGIRTQVETSLGRPLDEIFADFDPTPLAAASLAQVHKARLLESNEVVAVKVQRPDIVNTIKNDLRIMAGLARRIHERIESMQVYDLPGVIRELDRLLMHEVDFEREARNMRLAQNNFQNDRTLLIPEVHKEHTTQQVLVMELVLGTKLKNASQLSEEHKKRLARNGLRGMLKQILEDGFFHADPHPGNIIIREDGSFCLLDWGMVGRITQQTRFRLISLLEGIIDKDSVQVLDILLSMSQQADVVDRDSLNREVMDVLDDYHSMPLKDIHLGHLLTEMTNIFRDYRIRIRSDLAIMIKSLVTSEGTARLLYPDLDVVSEAEPYVRRIARKRYSPSVLWKELHRNLGSLIGMQRALPTQVNSILSKMEKGEFTIGFEHKRLEGLRQTMDRVANRLTLGILTAAMIIGSSMIITTGVRPFLFGYPALGLVGYLLSACVGGWVIFDIIRKKKM